MGVPPYLQYLYVMRSGGGNAAEQAYIDRVEADGGKIVNIGCVPDAIWDRPTITFTGLLDLYPGAAAAYSVRQLSSSATLCMRVRKQVASSPVYEDIGFVNNELDTAALLAFASNADNGDVFVVTWYDQAGSNDVTNATAANQPQIVSSGVVNLLDGRNFLDGDVAGDTMLQALNTIDSVGDIAIFSVYALTTDGTVANQITFEICNGTSTDRIHDTLGRGGAGTFGIDVRGSTNYDFGNATGVNVDEIYINSILTETNGFYINGTQQTSNNAVRSGSNTDALTLFNRGSGSFPYKGRFFEYVFYDSDQSSNRTGIEANVANHFGITL